MQLLLSTTSRQNSSTYNMSFNERRNKVHQRSKKAKGAHGSTAYRIPGTCYLVLRYTVRTLGIWRTATYNMRLLTLGLRPSERPDPTRRPTIPYVLSFGTRSLKQQQQQQQRSQTLALRAGSRRASVLFDRSQPTAVRYIPRP